MTETQKTKRGLEIPIPKRADFERVLKKIVKPVKGKPKN